ncbi:hypothetical protein ACFW04_012719 [Cataglyphis niger]
MLSWIYDLSKVQIIAQLTDRGLDPAGTLDVLRRRLRDHIISRVRMATKEIPKVGEDRFASASTTPEPPEGSPSKALNQIRKWGCHFDGKDPAFLERLEELSASYEIEEKYLLLGLPELLKGDALLWYRNGRDDWSTWADFCRDFRTHYLPRGYRLRLKQEIHGRRQKPGKALKKIDQLYINADPEIQLHVRYEDVVSVSDLCSRAAVFEDIDQRRRDHGRRPTDTMATLVAIHALGRAFWALLDSGSEVSFVNPDTAELARKAGRSPQPTDGYIRLANGIRAPVAEELELPFTVEGRAVTHTFQVLPDLGSPVLIGTDLWAELQITMPPPPRAATSNKPGQTATIEGEISQGINPRSPEEDERLREFLRQELQEFDTVRGPTNRITHQIRLKPGSPIKQRYRPRNPTMQAVINAEVDRMLEAGIIELSASAWSSPVVLVKKKDGTYRFCIDYRKLNQASKKDAYPLPHIIATLDKLRGARYLSTLDLKEGYWQVPLDMGSRPATAFTIPGRGLFQFWVMPFGLHSAPATFQRLLDSVLGPELEPNVLVYLDDIIVVSRTFDNHLAHLREVFRRLREARLRINTQKCHFCQDRLRYLGHIVDQEGVQTDPEKVSAITGWPAPTNVRQVRQFVGMASWYRRFVPDFSAVAAPLTRLTRKGARFTWSTEEERSFQRLKAALTTAPILTCPDFNKPFILQTDASSYGLEAVLTQESPEGECVIAYASRTLNGAERNYSATELECLAVVWGIRRMRDYLEGYRFTQIENPTGRLGRWLFELQQFDFDVRYRRGTLNQVADALSRRPEVCAIQGGKRCTWYNRVRRNLKARPADFPDYRMQEEKLFRHLLHSLDFRDVPTEGQWKISPRNSRLGPVAINLVEPLPRLTQGNAWLLTMQDRFSKWVEMVPLRRATAVGVIREFTRRVIYRHGCPDLVISDNGTQFTSRQIENAFKSFGVKHQTSPAYTPQCNPVEHANWTVKTMIAQYVGKKHRR